MKGSEVTFQLKDDGSLEIRQVDNIVHICMPGRFLNELIEFYWPQLSTHKWTYESRVRTVGPSDGEYLGARKK